MVKESKKSKGRIRKVWDSSKKLGRRLITTAILFHLGTHVNYTLNDIRHRLNPSPIRTQFEERFGFPIKGWKDDIEESPETVSTITEVIENERIGRPFSLRAFRVISDNYLKKSIPEQFFGIFGDGINYYNPIFDTIGISKGVGKSIISHEIKHAKTSEILKEDPKFLEKWSEFAKDENGNSLYSYKNYNISKFKLLEDLVNSNGSYPNEIEKLGFVSDYSQIHVLEDIAEFCATVEESPKKYREWMFENNNPRIIGKVKLAAEKNLIPYIDFNPEIFKEYTNLENNYNKGLWPKDCPPNREKIVQYLKESENFLEKYPDSIYECELRALRGNLMGILETDGKHIIRAMHTYKSRDHRLREVGDLLFNLQGRDNQGIRNAIKECEKALMARNKDYYYYFNSLIMLRNYYLLLDDEEMKRIYEEAEEELEKRRKNVDIKLLETGVNEYLKARGILSK